MGSLRNGRRRGGVLGSIALLASLGFAGSAVAIGPVSGARAVSPGAPILLVQNRPVSFADDQADRGKKRFVSECVDCHGDDLRVGVNGGPPSRGLEFDQKFADGAPASSMFQFMSTQMPPNDPGRYSPGVYADLMAYILKVNGYQPGAPLPSDADALDQLTVEK
jgi:mono/diheme cytochrome c family protein